MRLFKRKDQQGSGGATALAERPGSAPEFSGTAEELIAEIERLIQANRAKRDRATERRLMALRHLAGIHLVEAGDGSGDYPVPDHDRLPAARGLPEIAREDVTPELLRAGILRDGCLLVRGLVDRDDALYLADQIDRTFAEREKHDTGGAAAEGYYEEFCSDPRFPDLEPQRPWIKRGGGVLAADSPMLNFEMFEMLRAAGLPQLVEGYLGEPPLISLHKTTLRKADPSVAGAWHQDGTFMGDARALNLWLSLSRCGDESPGLDVVPRRLDLLTPSGKEMLGFVISQDQVEEAAGDRPVIRPIFEPGDALLFDEQFLHQTGSDPSMPKPRFAIENWYFRASTFPADYGPLAAL